MEFTLPIQYTTILKLVLAVGHLVALLMMLIWLYRLIKERLDSGNGLTTALIVYLLVTAFEKFWSVTITVVNLAMEPDHINALMPESLLDLFFGWWRVIAVWGIVFGIFYIGKKVQDDKNKK